MFKINPNKKVHVEILEDSKIFIIDDFYMTPDKVVEFLSQKAPYVHKSDDEGSYNGIYFNDLRHSENVSELRPVYRYLSSLCDRRPIGATTKLQTNVTRFNSYYTDWNDHENNYWWPHKDLGYTAIVYLNKDDTENGTNLYHNLCPDKEPPPVPEHVEPWRPKERFKLLKSLKPRYNRLVLFDGNKFLHGMNICTFDYYSNYYRINQSLFFDPE